MCLNPVYLNEKYITRKNTTDIEYWRIKTDNRLNKGVELIPLPCGKCVECLQQKSVEWSYRLKDELKQHKESCFVTLTYANTDGELHKRDYQLFLKRLRKHIQPKKIRYFLCGEFGSKGKRPHFHILIFGYIPKDLILFKTVKGIKYYLSEELSNLWGQGYILVERICDEHLKYVTKYMQKLNDVEDKGQKPFIAMSNRRGIGYNSISADCLFTDKIYQHGKYIKIPRYYLKILEDVGYDDFVEYVKQNRVKQAKLTNRKQQDYIQKNEKIKKSFSKLLTK